MRAPSSRRITASLLSMLTVSACAVGEDYQPPAPELASAWQALKENPIPSPAHANPEASNTPWWKQFGDETLSLLVEKALVGNNDLQVAEARVAEARAAEGSADAALLPEINATGSASRATLNAASGNQVDRTSQAGITGSWEIDIFGGNRRRAEAATASLEATIAQRDQARLTLLSDVARSYVQLRSLQQQHALILNNLAMQQDTLKVTKAQRKAGAISDLEVVRAHAQAEATSARLPPIVSAEFAAINRLCVLTGEKYEALKPVLEQTKPIPFVPAHQIAAMPLEAIARRPDVRASERQLAANTALSGAALAAFYPKLTLEGFFGPQNSQLFGNSSPWSASVNALLPLLNFGRLSSQLDAADARQQQAFFAYKQTVLLAVEETENAFSAYANERHRKATLANVAEQQAKAAKIAREQYLSGVATQLDLLYAENNQLQAETDVTLSEQTLAEYTIQLHRALYAGWSFDE